MRIIFINLLLFLVLTASAQNDSALRPVPKENIWMFTTGGDLVKGILINTTDSPVSIFPGKPSKWDRRSKILVANQSYLNIANIRTRKKGALLKGLLIGGGVGLLPVLLGSLFGTSAGQGGAYVSIITFPVGIITGSIIGSTSKKKFFIGGDRTRFLRFRKRMHTL